MKLHKFKVIGYCRDCTGSDFMGCNEGHVWEIGAFDTEEEARDAGERDGADCGPHDYKIIEIKMLKEI